MGPPGKLAPGERANPPPGLLIGTLPPGGHSAHSLALGQPQLRASELRFVAQAVFTYPSMSQTQRPIGQCVCLLNNRTKRQHATRLL